MDVLGFLLIVLVIAVIGIPLLVTGVKIVGLLLTFVPVILGLGLGGWLFFHGHDNVGVLLFLGSIGLNIPWANVVEKNFSKVLHKNPGITDFLDM